MFVKVLVTIVGFSSSFLDPERKGNPAVLKTNKNEHALAVVATNTLLLFPCLVHENLEKKALASADTFAHCRHCRLDKKGLLFPFLFFQEEGRSLNSHSSILNDRDQSFL